MSKSILLSRAVAPATAALGACLLAFAGPASAFSPTTTLGSENTKLDLDPSKGASHSGAAGTGGASIVRTIVGLAIVIAVIWGLAWILRQVKAGRDPQVSSSGLASVAALTLGSGRSVHLVRAGNDYVLLGSTEHGVAPIHRYTEEQAREAGLLLPVQEPERSRLLSTASQIVTGTGRVISQGGRAGQRALSSESAAYDEAPILGEADSLNSPVVGPRRDPMRMPSPSSGLIERMREWTVRR
jgi:flagellar protein FliO/FliZ